MVWVRSCYTTGSVSDLVTPQGLCQILLHHMVCRSCYTTGCVSDLAPHGGVRSCYTTWSVSDLVTPQGRSCYTTWSVSDLVHSIRDLATPQGLCQILLHHMVCVRSCYTTGSVSDLATPQGLCDIRMLSYSTSTLLAKHDIIICISPYYF